MNAVANLANLTSLNDERLLIQAAQSDPSRFAELYESNFNRVYAFVARRVKDREEAQDVTADVFHQALRNLGGFQWRGVPFAAWLLRIAANALAFEELSGTVSGIPVRGRLGNEGAALQAGETVWLSVFNRHTCYYVNEELVA